MNCNEQKRVFLVSCIVAGSKKQPTIASCIVAGSKKRPTIASCIVQGARNGRQSRPASCRKQETADNHVLHRAGSKKRPTIASCIVQEARNGRQSRPASLQGARNGLQLRPASCRKQETADNRVLHRAGSKKRPTIASCIVAEREKALPFRLNSCIFTLQWKD